MTFIRGGGNLSQIASVVLWIGGCKTEPRW